MSDFFQHEKALVESTQIGKGTRVWAFAHILPQARIGSDCNICDNVFVENDVVVGDRVTVKCGVQLWDGTRIGDDVFIGPNATFTNDRWPRSREWQETPPRITIENGASIGANATILPGITIGRGAMVGAGSVVTRSVPPYAVVVGNPGRIVRYTMEQQDSPAPRATTELPAAQLLGGATLEAIPLVRDMRGNLSAREIGRGLPFTPERYFVVLDVPTKEVRGEHAHKECHQLLVCLKGSVNCVVDNGSERHEIVLDTPEKALHLPPMIWGTQYKYTEEAVLLVLASHAYDPDDYIRDYDTFRSAVAPG
ncbi:WxcM-like domain-containing protein [Paracoccus tegillarcae]|uniref:Isomerase n=1 Tax=Paracoccus tegillarcae TaxID=1529068 RepID=A0A2K9EDP9_9RHOB|nr:WxcM-like domain-containing protein [Paracoccus tegillarcae]AUH33073.1 isomerase [Paracoccus tegillarcae]